MGCCGGGDQKEKSDGCEGHGNAPQSGSNWIVAVVLIIAMAAWILLK